MNRPRRPWVRLAGAGLLNLCLGTLFAWSVFLAPIEQSLAASRAEVSAVFSWSLVVFSAAVVVAGRMVDRLRSDVVAGIAAASTAAGLIVASVAPNIVVLGIGYVALVGGANGLGYLTAVDVASRGFEQRRGLAMGIVVGAYAAGPLVAGPLAGALIPELGWRAVMLLLAGALGATMLAAAALIGRSPDDSADASSPAGDPSSRAARTGVALLWVVFLTGALPALLAFGHAASIAADAGGAAQAGGLVVGGMAVGNVVGRAGGGAVSDRIGRPPALIGVLAAVVAVCAALGVTRSATVTVAALVLLGTCYGGLSALIPAATADLVGPQRFGVMYGWVFTGWGVAGLLGPLLGATLYERTGAYPQAFRMSALVGALGVGATVVLALRPHRG